MIQLELDSSEINDLTYVLRHPWNDILEEIWGSLFEETENNSSSMILQLKIAEAITLFSELEDEAPEYPTNERLLQLIIKEIQQLSIAEVSVLYKDLEDNDPGNTIRKKIQQPIRKELKQQLRKVNIKNILDE